MYGLSSTYEVDIVYNLLDLHYFVCQLTFHILPIQSDFPFNHYQHR